MQARPGGPGHGDHERPGMEALIQDPPDWTEPSKSTNEGPPATRGNILKLLIKRTGCKVKYVPSSYADKYIFIIPESESM